MVMRGIDISNWQSGIQPSKMPIDFCICKATEGLDFVDPYCDSWIQDCKNASIPFGFYHFARENDPKSEAEFFYDNCRGYFGKGIPVLDYETENASNKDWCERFLRRVHDLSGIWPMVYLSAFRVGQYKNSWIPSKCGLWIAGYPQTYSYWTDDEMPYSVAPWEFAAIWQFSSQVILPGYVGKLDANLAYMDEKGWNAYAGSNGNAKPIEPAKGQTVDEIVKDVLLGKYGSGDERKKKLGSKYDEVQARVNKLYDIADEVIDGIWGNGSHRKEALEKRGYPYELVQKIVNDKLA